MTFLLDMNIPPVWIGTLERAGYKAIHRSSIGHPSAPDAHIMNHARERGWVVFTHDLDFGTILAHSGATGPSVVQIREQNLDPEIVGHAVVAGLKECFDVLQSGALVTIDLSRAKARVLPIRRQAVSE